LNKGLFVGAHSRGRNGVAELAEGERDLFERYTAAGAAELRAETEAMIDKLQGLFDPGE